MPDSIIVYQNYYHPSQVQRLDPAFIPHDGCSNARPELREIALFVKLYQSEMFREGTYTGILSHKFGAKAKISGEKFLAFMRANPGFDVYFINPFPQNAYFSFNVWEHGEFYHPGLSQLGQRLFSEAGIDWQMDRLPRNDRSTLLYCNYWVGNEEFWRYYMAVIERLLGALDRMPAEQHKAYFSPLPDTAPVPHPAPAPMLSFLMERIFSTVLATSQGIKACPYQHSSQELDAAFIHDMERTIHAALGRVIDTWDGEQCYTTERRQIFQFLTRASGLYHQLQFSISGFTESLL